MQTLLTTSMAATLIRTFIAHLSGFSNSCNALMVSGLVYSNLAAGVSLLKGKADHIFPLFRILQRFPVSLKSKLSPWYSL